MKPNNWNDALEAAARIVEQEASCIPWLDEPIAKGGENE